jgi:hypothetical protein
MAPRAPGERNLDPGIKLVLGELRDLRVEMRADRQRSDEERRRADEERRQADDRLRQDRAAADERLRQDRAAADERLRQERLESNQFLLEMRGEFREFRADSIRREAAMQKAFTDAFKQVHTVGLAIVRTLNRHTQILERIDRRLSAPGNGRRGRDDGRGR